MHVAQTRTLLGQKWRVDRCEPSHTDMTSVLPEGGLGVKLSQGQILLAFPRSKNSPTETNIFWILAPNSLHNFPYNYLNYASKGTHDPTAHSVSELYLHSSRSGTLPTMPQCPISSYVAPIGPPIA